MHVAEQDIIYDFIHLKPFYLCAALDIINIISIMYVMSTLGIWGMKRWAQS